MVRNSDDKLLLAFNATIDQWITALDGYTLETLCRKPRPGSWSMGQVYVHIMNDTGYFVEQVRECLQNNGTNAEKDMHADAKAIFRNNGFPDITITGPATDDSVPQPPSIEIIKQTLVSIREEANRLHASFDFSAAAGKTQHPGLLFFSASEWLRFAEMHMRHHFRQKKRIEAALAAS